MEGVKEKRNQVKREGRNERKGERGQLCYATQNELVPLEAVSGAPGEGTGLRVDCRLLRGCFAQSKVKGHLQNQISIRAS